MTKTEEAALQVLILQRFRKTFLAQTKLALKSILGALSDYLVDELDQLHLKGGPGSGPPLGNQNARKDGKGRESDKDITSSLKQIPKVTQAIADKIKEDEDDEDETKARVEQYADWLIDEAYAEMKNTAKPDPPHWSYDKDKTEASVYDQETIDKTKKLLQGFLGRKAGKNRLKRLYAQVLQDQLGL
jgi:hypothetical protein